MSKKEHMLSLAGLLARHVSLFRCPVCGMAMNLANERSLSCTSGHLFDLSRDGYVHLMPNAKPGKYDKELFAARKLINGSGYFNGLLEELFAVIAEHFGPEPAAPLSVLDAGCGEGSHLSALQAHLESRLHRDVIAVGADLSKPGVRTAAKGNPRALWCVADLARSPFQDESFDVITNILSPSNYGEFRRLLANGGMLAKVVPGPEYLRELRQFLYGRQARRDKDPERTAALFAEHFPDMEERRVRYETLLDPRHLEAMLRMTPLSWHAPEEQVRRLLAQSSFRMTFDFYILWGKHFR
ncbi:putative RNA methyltransferase [Paenibacillus sp. USDA918EY]|uniref:putative RNA methyltransferase n=1 Tax=Paenibacillus sp. USDA918EY TaxID=2689575 RepID=UPI00135753CB|nr:methyltransferase domain-containing protein [Paenibacillus sp. USDA918EY]